MKNSIRHICYGAVIGGTERRRDRQCTYESDFKARSCFHCCRGKVISATYSECVSVALLTQHAKRTRCIILSSVACLAVPCFSKLNGIIFGKALLNLNCVFLFSLLILSETFLILRRNERGIVVNVHWSSSKVPVILVRL